MLYCCISNDKIIIPFKGAMRDFFTISSLWRELSPTRMLKLPGRNCTQVTCNTLSAYHVQHVVLYATRNEGTAQLLSLTVCLFVGCLTSQQHASVSQGQICTDNFTCCHTDLEVADPTFYLTQSQYTDTGRTSSSADPIMPGTWQGSHWSADF